MSLYREHARAYAAHTAVSQSNAGYERPAVQKVLGEVAGQRVLDAGCASGEHTAWLQQHGARVSAIDASPEMIAIVRERYPDVLTYCADLSDPLSFLDAGSFDLVLSSLTLHYLQKWESTLREFHRVLRDGGRLVVSTHHPALTSPWVADYFKTQLVHDAFMINGKSIDVEFYHRPLEEVLRPFLDEGFQIVSLHEPAFQGKPWFLIIDTVKRPQPPLP